MVRVTGHCRLLPLPFAPMPQVDDIQLVIGYTSPNNGCNQSCSPTRRQLHPLLDARRRSHRADALLRRREPFVFVAACWRDGNDIFAVAVTIPLG